MEQTITSLKKTARLAGFLYLIMGLTGFYTLMYVPSQITVKGDTTATIHNILSHEFLFRTAIASTLISGVLSIYMAMVLYKLFKQVNALQARLLVAFVIAPVPISFAIETFRIAALMIFKGELLKTLEPAQAQDVAMLFLKMYSYGTVVWEIFMGFWLIPFGILVYRSKFILRIIGVLLFIAGIGYTVDSLTFILFPEYLKFTKLTAYTLSGIGEVSIMLWLLIIGVKDHLSITVISETSNDTKIGIGKLKEHFGS